MQDSPTYPGSAQGFKPYAAQGLLPSGLQEYGRSHLGTPLLYLPSLQPCRLLVIAGLHGEEADTTFLLSRSLRLMGEAFAHAALVLCANTDGLALGTRGNARGVDLNRNWPSPNWSPATVHTRLVLDAPRVTELSPGASPASEPETRALQALIEKLSPEEILSLHSPLACVDAPKRTLLVKQLCRELSLPWQSDIGYPTPGSLGSWCMARDLHCVTLELPLEASETLARRFAAPLARLLEAYGK